MYQKNSIVLFVLLICIQFIGFSQTHPKNIQGEQINKSIAYPVINYIPPSNNNSIQDEIISDNAFLKGQHIEIGIAPCGCFGTTVSQPLGFHGNMEGPLGFVADPDKDGWDVGDPAYNGDYFLPGSPEEGFGVEISGTNYGNYGKCTQNQIPMTSVSISYINDIHYAVWEGETTNGLSIKNTTFFNDTASYFMVLAQLVNTTASTMNDVYYMRNVEPDNEVKWGGSYATENEIVYQPNTNTCSKALVTATGQEYGMYLGLGAADSRARVTYGGFSNRSASGIFNATGVLSHTGSQTLDQAISIAFQVGDLAPGDTANLLYSYILDEDQLNAAMSEMIRIMANGTDITTSLIYSDCAGIPINLEIVNGDDFSWLWSPNIYLNSNSGTQVLASPLESIAYTAVGTNECATIMYDFDIVVTEDEFFPVISNCPGDQFLLPNSGECGFFVSDNSLDPMATDNCYLASFEHNFNGGGSSLNGASFPTGTTEVLWIAEDGVGHRDSCSCIITVDGTDIQNPTAVCQDINLSLNEDGIIFLNGTEINNGSSDNCGISSFSASPSTFSCNDLGPNLVTLTVFDGIGNSDNCQAILTVVDEFDPIPVITNKVFYLDENGNLDFTVNDLDFGSWDNCGILNKSIDINSFSCLDTNVNVVNFTVTDINGNSASEIVYVTVLDTLNPIIQSDQILVELSNGSYTLSEDEIITDNCDFTATLSGQTFFDCSDVGNFYSLGVSVIDVNGNENQGQLSIQVKNGNPPIPTIEILPELSDECIVSITEYPTATDVCLGVIIASTVDPLLYSMPGIYTIHWLFDDGNGNTSTQNQQVIIDDVSTPVPDIEVLDTIYDECSVSLSTPMATDNCTGIISANTTTIFPLYNSDTVIWIYDDGNGNVSYQNQLVIIEDVSSPVPDSVNLSTIYSECEVSLSIPSSNDNCDGEIFATTVSEFPLFESEIVSWIYTDASGNESYQTQEVIIQDASVPVPNIEILDTIFSECAVTPLQPTALDNCDGELIATTTSIFPIVSSETITWTYTDDTGNEYTQIQEVIIEDLSGPIPDVLSLSHIVEECSASPGTPTATDNCNVEILATTSSSFPLTESTIITWVYTDLAGNETLQTQEIIIEDTTAPVFDLPELDIVFEECSASLITPTATDNCDGDLLGTTTTVFPLTESTLVTWIYTDIAGNVSSQTQEIVIEDVTAPIWDLETLITVNSECSVSLVAPTASDNCDGELFGTTTTVFPVSESTTVTWTYTDETGNVYTQSQEIVIEDVTVPVADLEFLPNVYDECSISLIAPIATDNCDGELLGTTSSEFPLFESELVSWIYIDASGNESSQTQEVIIEDVSVPVLNIETLDAIYSECAISPFQPTAIDNCDGEITATTSSSFPLTESTIITWVYTDAAGNEISQTQEVIIEDISAPIPDVLNLSNIVEECSVSPVIPTATDNCDGEIFATTSSSFPIIESTTITWVYTDISGNESFQDQEILIEDVTVPQFDLSELTPVIEECFVSLTPPSATDNCDGEIIGVTNTILPITESTTVIWTYTDESGNISTQNQEVLIEDVTAPIPNLAELESILEECSALAMAPLASDNCNGSIEGTSSINFPITESTVVSWTFEDESGNISIQTQEFIIIDTSSPIPNEASLETVNGLCSATLSAPLATDNCDGELIGTTLTSFPVYTSTLVSWEFIDNSGNSTIQNQQIIISDNMAPVANTEVLEPIFEQCSVTIIPPTATDNCGEIITGTTESIFPLFNSETVVWTYMDASGNFTIQNQNVTIIDDTAPVAVVENLEEILAECFISPDPPIAIDNCDGELEGTTITTFPITETTLITWTFVDVSGNISSQTQEVIIEDVTGPLPSLNELQTINAECSAEAPVTPLAIDNCDGEVVGITDAEFPIFVSTTIVWTFTDAAGNISTQLQEMLIEDVTVPIPDISNLPTITEDCSASLDSPTATDNCDGGIIGTTTSTFPILENSSVIWTFEDESGNTSSQIQEVIIDDQTSPIFNLSELPIITEQCEALEPIAPTATDECDGVILGSTNIIFPITESTNLTWTYTDASGNSSFQIQEIIINDITYPTIVCPEDFTIMADDESNTYTVQGNHLNPISYNDNCNVESISNNLDFNNTLDDAIFSWGYTSVVWTVGDGAGNLTTCGFEVNIDEFVGIHYINKDNIFRIYPNPSRGDLNIDIEAIYKESLDVSISNTIGIIVFNKSFNKNKTNFSENINLNHLLPGVYFLRIKSENINVLEKIVIE